VAASSNTKESEGGSYFQRKMSLSGGSSESVMMQGMLIDMEEARLQTLAQVKAFLDGTAEVSVIAAQCQSAPQTRRHL
jgi:hypothetical protein